MLESPISRASKRRWLCRCHHAGSRRRGQEVGLQSVVNLRQASEAGADIDGEAAAAKAAGINFVHLPFNAQAPDPMLVERFLKVVTDPGNQPAFIHCASGNRAAALWLIKRVEVDKWPVDRASEEAAALGLTSSALKTFALDQIQARATQSALKRPGRHFRRRSRHIKIGLDEERWTSLAEGLPLHVRRHAPARRREITWRAGLA